MRKVAVAFVAIGSVGLTLAAQQSESRLRFDVASIKARTADDSTPFRVSFEPGGRFVTVNAPLTFWMGRNAWAHDSARLMWTARQEQPQGRRATPHRRSRLPRTVHPLVGP